MASLARLYLASFDRDADYEGLEYYAGEAGLGVGLAQIAREFAASEEFTQRFGALDDAAFIDRLYANVFDGAGEASQRARWREALASGAMTRGDVLLAFAQSEAFRAATDNEVFVTVAFAEVLGQVPGPAERARWLRWLDAGHPRSALIAALAPVPRR